MSGRDPFAPIIEGFDCSGLTDPYSLRCEPFFVDGENGGTLLDGSTVHDILAAKVRFSWRLNVMTPAQYAALNAATLGVESLDTVSAFVYDSTVDAVRLARFHVTRPSCRTIRNLEQVWNIPQSELVLEEAAPVARFEVTPPVKTSYSLWDELDLSGLAVTAYDADGVASDITDGCYIDPADGTQLLVPGAFPLSVSYDAVPLYSAVIRVADTSVIASGDCWTLYDNGTIFVYDVESITETLSAEWTDYKHMIARVNVCDGVKEISMYAFFEYPALKNVSLPNSCIGFGYGAFYGCQALESVIIPYGATNISIYAFCSCGALKVVAIPDSLTNIGASAFEYCTKLEDITIPESVINIGEYAFRHTGIRSVTINRDATVGAGAFPPNCRISYYEHM